MNPNTEARSASVPVSLFPAKGGNGKGYFAEGDARHALTWARNQTGAGLSHRKTVCCAVLYAI